MNNPPDDSGNPAAVIVYLVLVLGLGTAFGLLALALWFFSQMPGWG